MTFVLVKVWGLRIFICVGVISLEGDEDPDNNGTFEGERSRGFLKMIN